METAAILGRVETEKCILSALSRRKIETEFSSSDFVAQALM